MHMLFQIQAKSVRSLAAWTLALLLAGCAELADPSGKPQQAKPFGASPLPGLMLNKLYAMLPEDWENPPRSTNPTSTQMRLLYRICGKKRNVKQEVIFIDAPTTQSERSSTLFLDSSGQYILGIDQNQDPERKESTRFILYYDKPGEVFRGVSWTRNSLGEDDPVQMVGQLERGTGKAVVEWRPFNVSIGVITRSRLFLTSAENFIWEVKRIRDGKIVTQMTNKSTLKLSWP